MALPHYSVYLHCPSCDKVEFCNAERLVVRLRSHNMLRRNAEPDEGLLRILVAESSKNFECSECGRCPLEVSAEDPFDDGAWGDPVKCQICGETIPKERIEIFPKTRLCTKCQVSDEKGEIEEEPDYCPRCGDIMRMKQRTTGGIAGYRLVCPACNRS